MISINSNIAALRLQRLLGESSARLGLSFERLSSGQRINRASDDAAGLSIADQLRVRSRLYSGASRNINDGISAINIASSTIGNQTLILERMMELASQSANGSYSTEQRAAMMKEYRQLSFEFGRLGNSTSFNGLNLLIAGRGTNPSRLVIQTGVDGTGESSIGMSLGDTGVLSGIIREGYAYGSGIANADYTERTEASLYSGYNQRLARFTVKDAQGAEKEVMVGLEYTNGNYRAVMYQRVGDTAVLGGFFPDGFSSVSNNPDNWVRMPGGGFTVNAATGKVNGTGEITLTYRFDSDKNGSYESVGYLGLDLRGLTFLAAPTLTMFQQAYGSNEGVSNIDFTGIENAARALDALKILGNRLTELHQLNGQFGAMQSRLEQALNIALISQEANKAAESRIRDVDVAAEAARLTAQQILQQTASSVLRSASKMPELALQLLRPPSRNGSP
ncbi:MAG: flagellin [Bdellovibrionota bacterium]|nr:MAG: flagellin [Bdellovibrionota bacterium]